MDGLAMGKCTPSTPHSAVTGGYGKRPKSSGQEARLLPGIPDEITLDLVCTKLPWKAFHVLFLVSKAWNHAIESHSVYEARVRSQTRDTLLVHSHTNSAFIALYSASEKRCFELPPIPGFKTGRPWKCGCVSSEGKVYVLGGLKVNDDMTESQRGSESMVLKSDNIDTDKKDFSKEVYVLDLVGQRRWRRCESMHEGRFTFASGVVNGKIYAFGGLGPSGPLNESEVYDPTADAWSPIKPMPCQRFGDTYTVMVGEEICVYNGVYAVKGKENNLNEWLRLSRSLYVYHPTKDEWRVVDSFLTKSLLTRTLLGVEGKLHRMCSTRCSTDRAVYISETNEWEVLPPDSFDVIEPSDLTIISPLAATVVDDVVFAAVSWTRHECNRADGVSRWLHPNFGVTTSTGIDLFEGRRFSSQEEGVQWQALPRVMHSKCDFKDIMDAVQL